MVGFGAGKGVKLRRNSDIQQSHRLPTLPYLFENMNNIVKQIEGLI
jgi:hypothetical protein